MQPRSNNLFFFGLDFNFNMESPWVGVPEGNLSVFPPVFGHFLLLDGTPFLLLDGTDLLLL